MSANLIYYAALILGGLFIWQFYKLYKQTDEEKRPRLVLYYTIIAIVSIALFAAGKYFDPFNQNPSVTPIQSLPTFFN